VSTVVLDTNVLLALWIFDDPEVALLRATLEAGELQPLRSVETDAELAEVLARPGLFNIPPERQAGLQQAWQARARLVTGVLPAPARCRDPLDQKFVDLAVTAGARWLITRDKALLKLNRKLKGRGLGIVTPAAWSLAAVARSP
jgi:putative PIN family toxin of toxin-antitoxin system